MLANTVLDHTATGKREMFWSRMVIRPNRILIVSQVFNLSQTIQFFDFTIAMILQTHAEYFAVCF